MRARQHRLPEDLRLALHLHDLPDGGSHPACRTWSPRLLANHAASLPEHSRTGRGDHRRIGARYRSAVLDDFGREPSCATEVRSLTSVWLHSEGVRDQRLYAGIARSAPQNAALGIGMSFDPFDLAATRQILLDGFHAMGFPACRHGGFG